MIRVSCALVLFALILLFAMLLRTIAQTTVPFTFLGMPSLAVAILVYGYSVWRGSGGSDPGEG